MYPLDFEEFALFLGEELLLEYICKCYQNREPLEKSMHNKAMRLFKEYILVGGMPQAVLAYKNGGVILRLPIRKNLSTHEKKIVLSSIDTNPTFDKYGEPLFWLDDSMLCNLCYKCNDPNVGFALNKNESSVKCYLGDTGLLVSLAFNENEPAEKFQLK